jgi:hypothetical protein
MGARPAVLLLTAGLANAYIKPVIIFLLPFHCPQF